MTHKMRIMITEKGKVATFTKPDRQKVKDVLDMLYALLEHCEDSGTTYQDAYAAMKKAFIKAYGTPPRIITEDKTNDDREKYPHGPIGSDTQPRQDDDKVRTIW